MSFYTSTGKYLLAKTQYEYYLSKYFQGNNTIFSPIFEILFVIITFTAGCSTKPWRTFTDVRLNAFSMFFANRVTDGYIKIKPMA